MNSPDNSREAALRGLHEYREGLAAQMKTLEQDMSAVERSIALLDHGVPPSREPTEAQEGFAALGATDAVIRFLREAKGRAFKPTIMAKELVRRGFMPKNSKTFSQQVTSTVKRVMHMGVHNIRRKKNRDGHWVYFVESKNPAE